MASEYPHPVGGRISDDTKSQLDEAIRRGPTEGKLVRMALEDYLPRYLAGQTHTENAEFIKKVGTAIRRRPSLMEQLNRVLIAECRPSRRTG